MQRDSFRNILKQNLPSHNFERCIIFVENATEVEYVSCCEIVREYLKPWIEGNKMADITGCLITVHKEDTDKSACPNKDFP